jgi:uncharacterized protein
MSKPGANSAQNLEEILASIRKSLVDDGADGSSKARKLPAAAASDGLSSRLAGALGGSGDAGNSGDAGDSGDPGASLDLDGALADFFAHVPGKDAAPAEPAKPSAAPEPKDPFWFLTRPGAATPVAADDKAGARSAPAEERVTLSRPETLRPSLPPLFVSEGEAALAIAPSGVVSGSEPAAVVPTGSAVAASLEAQVVQSPKAQRPAVAAALDIAPPEPAHAAAGPGPAAAFAGIVSAPQTTTETLLPDATAAARKEAAATSRNPALEDMIAQLLEPVLVNWLDANLPRMIETLVRAEVARALSSRP